MAEARKPARKPAKRGPTKAAALKALGLTQEDLDYLKERNSPPTTEPNVVEGAATARLSRSDPQAALEERPAPPRTEGGVPETAEEPTWYMRNLRGVEVSFRLSRQSESTQKRTALKPRGSRGDMQKLEPGDLKDSELKTQVAYGLIEVIPEGEALEALKKQYTNQQVQVPPHIAMLRNERGEEYNTAPRTTSDEESMGYKVADLDPAIMQGKRSDKEIKRDAGISQSGVTIEPVQNPSPGKIVTDGFLAPTQTDMSGDNERAAEIDAKVRANQFEGPADAIGVDKVTVEPTQKVQ